MFTSFDLPDLKPYLMLVPALMGLLLFNPSFITLFTASNSELKLLGKELRILIKSSFYIFFAILFPFITMFFINDDTFISHLFLNNYVLILWLLSFLFLIYLNLGEITQKKFTPKTTLQKSIVFYIFTFYMIINALIFGLFSHYIYSSTNLTNKFELLVFIYIIQYFLLKPCLNLMPKIYTEEIRVCIRLTNGEKIQNAYLLYPMFGKKILLGDKSIPSECRHKIAIAYDRIEYIEFYITPISWGQKAPQAFTTIVPYKEDSKINDLFK
ncbi:hypothetical protein [Brevibacillus parabrevis]|uniref:hypothetical protein n=1 Tax=Brevibacillus parabrevis TaxID=54914 RepID=UPI00238082D1|nr:hypothetical protein [Brevibacillus parabrevis]MED2253158.1 hypothetical protein [Brevibacillus parabrevis]WDV97198.1 hypothetical protein PSE45_09650 [Brevibacillus parabrevis]